MNERTTQRLVFAAIGTFTIATVAVACGGSVEDDGKGGAGGNGTPASTTQQGSTTNSVSNSNSVVSSTDANVGSTTDGSSNTGICGPGAQTTAQTGGSLFCFIVPQAPCPDQDGAECYLNRNCMAGEEGLDVVAGPNGPPGASTASTAGSGGNVPEDRCCYFTEGLPCGTMPGMSTGGGSGSGFGSSTGGGSGSGFGSSSGGGSGSGFGSSSNGGSGSGGIGSASSGN